MDEAIARSNETAISAYQKALQAAKPAVTPAPSKGEDIPDNDDDLDAQLNEATTTAEFVRINKEISNRNLARMRRDLLSEADKRIAEADERRREKDKPAIVDRVVDRIAKDADEETRKYMRGLVSQVKTNDLEALTPEGEELFRLAALGKQAERGGPPAKGPKTGSGSVVPSPVKAKDPEIVKAAKAMGVPYEALVGAGE